MTPASPKPSAAAREPFDPGSPARARRRLLRLYAAMIALCALAIGAMIAAAAERWRLFLPSTLAAGAFLALLCRLLLRVRPSVSCRTCPAAGWIDDLAATAGACPRCGGTRFDYRGMGVRVYPSGALPARLPGPVHGPPLARGPRQANPARPRRQKRKDSGQSSGR